ncbi:hypothetical protein CPJCM30710_32680 [Clostridium polyendosporum]|uniref:PTS EIIC type-2 domain-containing protein n=1 Tax=Clostridium polyendosporum TaxID=69208 RepID=A0A919VHU2_9CLOT|nr:PTS fructose transporter subunit IIC [Clostridium polyendosporum]GIM30602.1 hypothetical protein CPJCM30710_32680 [Clostridium polyendosporum]
MKNSRGTIFQQHLMTGISYMIPVVVSAGMLMGIGIMAGQSMGFDAWDGKLLQGTPNELQSFFAWMTQVAGAGMMGLMFPVFAAFLAYGIADKLALAPGFIGGLLAQKMGSGFLGAMLIGLLAGYSVKYLNEKIKIKRTFMPIKTLFIIPVATCVLVVVASRYVVGPIGQLFINAITSVINLVGQTGELAVAVVIGGAMAFDLGGPVNKTALALSMQLNTDAGISAWVPAMIGAVIPPIGIGLAVFIDKFVVRRSVFDDGLRTNGMSCFILGFMGISEGAIPFAIKDPLFMIPLNVVGSAVGAGISHIMGTYGTVGVPAAIWGWPLATNPLGWVVGVVVGSLIVCFGAIFRMNYLVKKKEKEEDVVANVVG